MSGYFKQVLCYACTQTAQLLRELSTPTTEEVSYYQLTGWNTTTSWLSQTEGETQRNLANWGQFIEHKLLGDTAQAPNLLGFTVLSTAIVSQGTLSLNSTLAEVIGSPANVAKARNLVAYSWLAATGQKDPRELCYSEVLNCTEPTRRVKIS